MTARLPRLKAGRIAALTILVGAFCSLGARHGQDAIANGDTRSLNIYHSHTHESAVITFMRDGAYDPEGLKRLNWILRDWRKDEPINMDPHLFDVVWAAYREVGSQEPIQVVSAYRSPSTNAMLRRHSSAVAKNSQHMAGKAMDFHLTDVSMARVREVGLRLQRGGVGYYPTAGTPFVHLDTGTVRHWPRATREYLTQLFPDGKTVHIPSDGKPLERYAEAAAEIQALGGSAIALADLNTTRGKSLWATLFGGDGDEDEEQPNRRGKSSPGRTVLASAAASPISGVSDDNGVRAFLTQSYAPTQASVVASTPIPLPKLGAAKPVIAPQPEAVAVPANPAGKIDQRIELAEPQLLAVPLPPKRPVLVAGLSGPDNPPTGLFTRVDVPVPPVRPAAITAAVSPLLAEVPLPPQRSTAVATLIAPATTAGLPGVPNGPLTGPRSLPSAIIGPDQALPSALVAYAPAIGVPLPPTPRPTRVAAIAKAPIAAQPIVPAPVPVSPTEFGVKLDRAGISALMSRVTSKTETPNQPLKVAAPSVQVALSDSVVAGRFDRSGQAIVESGKFSGTDHSPDGPAPDSAERRITQPMPSADR